MMRLRNKDLNLLPIFDALMREQQLSKAAEQLGMSQPAVSNALKRIRHSFGNELFVRTKQGLKPTPYAIELHDAIGPALEMIRHTYGARDFDPETSTRTINIAMDIAAEYAFGADLVTPLRQSAPNLNLNIHPDYIPDIPSRLKDGRLDYALEYTPMDSEQFDSRLFVREKLTVICAKNHPVVQGEITLEQYETLPHISLVPRTSLFPGQSVMTATPVEHILGADIPQRNIALRVTSSLTIPPIVAATDLIATITGRISQEYIDKGVVQGMPPPYSGGHFEIRLYWHKSKTNDPVHKWLMQKLDTAFAVRSSESVD